MAAERVQVELELERDSDPIRGTVRVDSRTSEFSGWLALIAELDGLWRHDEEQEDEQP
ncbi:MAG TPA: hypothetical protein VFZ89_05770 [Solirubrobacteraceae bacterium]